MARSYQIWLFENVADGSWYKFGGIVALFVRLGTIFIMKHLNDNTYIYMEGQ